MRGDSLTISNATTMNVDNAKMRLLEARMVRVASPGTSREGFGLDATPSSNSLTQNVAKAFKPPVSLDQNNKKNSKNKQLKRPAPTSTSSLKPTTSKKPRQLQRGAGEVLAPTFSESISSNPTSSTNTSISPSDSASPKRTKKSSSSSPSKANSSPLNASTARPIDTFFHKKTSPPQSTSSSSSSSISSTDFTSTTTTTTNKNNNNKASATKKSNKSSNKNSAKKKSQKESKKYEIKRTFVGPSSTSMGSGDFRSAMLPPASISAAERIALAERSKLQNKLLKLEQHVNEQTKHAKFTEEQWSNERKRLTSMVTETRNECNTRVNRAAHALEDVLRKKAVSDSIQSHLSLATNSHRLGRVVIQRTSTKSVEMWEDGHVFRDLETSKTTLELTKTKLEARKKELQNKRRTMNRTQKQAIQSEASNDGFLNGTNSRGNNSMDATSSSMSNSNSTTTTNASSSSSSSSAALTSPIKTSESLEQQHAFNELALASEEEALKMAQDELKTESVRITTDAVRLENEKTLHIRETKRMRDEDASRFNCRPVLHQRYLLLRLLGRGGFSEVWEAYDLRMFVKVAVKIHQLNPHWNEAKKSNYTKHATREYEIHKTMTHPNVVKLIDVFEIDHDSFATVLELCEGDDLDMRLKKMTKLNEREARSILIQVMRGLLYLNVGDGITSTPKIIHYDLKPGNILFDTNGIVKITDFGLSKVFEDGGVAASATMELTSQGAGTYWYLPPECFVVGDAPPQISSKVDVWAIGVMFYQMLYGKRPFGEGLSQERILTNNTILNARNVEFPKNSKEMKVTDSAKEFIQRCLTHSQLYRPDIPGICMDSYLANSKKKR